MTASSSVAAKKKRKPLAVSSCQVRLLKKPNSGEILAVGTGRVLDNGEVRALAVKVGDKVVFGPYSGSNTVKVDGEDLLVMARTKSSLLSKADSPLIFPLLQSI